MPAGNGRLIHLSRVRASAKACRRQEGRIRIFVLCKCHAISIFVLGESLIVLVRGKIKRLFYRGALIESLAMSHFCRKKIWY